MDQALGMADGLLLVQPALVLRVELEGLSRHAHAREAKKAQMMKTDMRRLAEARVTAAEAIAAYDKAAEKCKEAAQKYDEASRLSISDKFKEYLILKVKEYNKRAEMVATAKGTPQALIESTNRSSFVIRANSNNNKVDQLYKEAEDIGAQADKLQKDNPNIFKS